MPSNVQALTEKEKETLRLLLAGHDAKSMARHLGLSVHTINERLRISRRKLSASNSKEAARLLREAEGVDPQSIGDKPMGDPALAPAGPQGDQPSARPIAMHRMAWAIGGLAMITFLVAALALSTAPESSLGGAAPLHTQTTTPRVEETQATQIARQWLALVDAENWQESWAGTAASFQSRNTPEVWEKASVEGRVPLGRVLSRRLVSEESIPVPPNGNQLVRFRTDFSNKADATETLSLAREGGRWRIAGYIID